MTNTNTNFGGVLLTQNQKATKALQKAFADINGVMTGLSLAVDQSVIIDEAVATRQAQLDALDHEYNVKADEANYALRIRVRDNEDKVLADLLKARGLVSVTNVELAELKETIANAEDKLKAEVSKAVSIVSANVTREKDAQILQIRSEAEISVAKGSAETIALTRENEMLKAQVADLKQMIADERNASVKKAEADANKQAVTVNTGR